MRLNACASLVAAAVCLSFAAPAMADRDDHRWRGGGHGHFKGGNYKQTFRDGPCKVERRFKRNGNYEEKRTCKPRYSQRHDYRHDHGRVVQPARVYPAVPRPIYPAGHSVRPGVYVQPPTVVIQPPGFVLR